MASDGKRVERGEREVIPSTAEYSKRQWSRFLAFSAKGRGFDRPTFPDIDGISSFHVCSCARGGGGGRVARKEENASASTCLSLSDRARRYPARPVYADEWNSFQGTSGPFSNTPLWCGVDANNAKEEYVSEGDRQNQEADKGRSIKSRDERISRGV